MFRSLWVKGTEGERAEVGPKRWMFLVSGLAGSYAATGPGSFFASRITRIGGTAYLLVTGCSLLFSGLTCSALTGLFGTPVPAAAASEGH